MTQPEIINENQQMDLIRGRARHYTPEWTFEDDKDAGAALSMVFAYMAEIAVKRLNAAPQKHFLSFLEMINASLIPAQPARVPLKFELSKGTPENILIPAHTQAFAPGADGKPIIFETEKNITATPSNLASVVSVINKITDGDNIRDEIFDHRISINGSDQTGLFRGENRQEHILYIGDKNLLNVGKGTITIHLDGEGLDVLDKDKYIVWEYGVEVTEKKNGEEIKKIDWCPFESYALNTANNKLLKITKGTKIFSWINISGTEMGVGNDNDNLIGFLIRNFRVDWVKDAKIDITDLKIVFSVGEKSISLELKDNNTVELKINGEITYEFRKEGDDIYDTKEPEPINEIKLDGLKSRWMRCRVKDSNIEEVKNIRISKLMISTEHSEGITPDMVFSNGVPIDMSKQPIDVYPFGDKPTLYSTFYIASKDAFTKKNYTVSLNICFIPGSPSSSANTPMLSWEYWDGEGWNHLNVTEVAENFTLFIENNATGGGPHTIKLTDDTISGKLIKIIDGAGTGQIRKIIKYDKSAEEATVDSDWNVQPDNTSIYRIFSCCDSSSTNLDRVITIPTMPEVKKTGINGKENYWIRVRLIGGDYGKEYEVRDEKLYPGYFCPPVIKNLKIKYTAPVVGGAKEPEYVITRNNLISKRSNLSAIKVTDEKSSGSNSPLPATNDILKPFETLPDTCPTLYFGFDKQLSGKSLNGGTFSLFISINEKFEYPEDFRPKIKWKSRIKDGTWKELDNILDETAGFTRSGLVLFDVREELGGKKLFGSQTDLFWIRAEIIDDFFDPDSLDKSNKTPPEVLGFYLNSIWAVQSRRIVDENIGSSTGDPGQRFYLQNRSLTSEEIWVNEVDTLTESEREKIQNPRKRNDNKGNLIEFWVKWKDVGDFVNSGPKDRDYMIDRTSGEIRFGDGKHGSIPPIRLNNIRASYSIGGGKAGNLEAFTIKKLQSAVPFVDKVINPIASDGGTDTEEIDSLLTRAPITLKNRNRAVAFEDFRWLTKEASRKVARVKVMPNTNSERKFQTGHVTVVIVPQSNEDKPVPSPELRNRVKTYLKDRSPNIVTLYVIQPSYARASVEASIVTNEIDAIPVIESKGKTEIKKFFHPLTGGAEGKGWNFGALPCISDIYSILEGIENVDYVANVLIRIQRDDNVIDNEIVITDTSGEAKLSEYSLLYSGDHEIIVNLRGGG